MNNSADTIKKASEWYIRLTSGQATEVDYQAWQQWKNAQPEHALAWQTVEAVTQPFTTIDKTLGLAVLNVNADSKKTSNLISRRQALKQLSLLLVVGTSGMLAYQLKPWQQVLADYSTDIGERRDVRLQDGTRLTLNTDSLVGIHYTESYRLITLYRGEVLVETGHEKREHYRPLSVKTAEGSVTALGTRFTTRQHDGYTSVNLYEGALAISPKNSALSAITLAAGESVKFNDDSIIQKSAAALGSDAWSTGFIVVDKIPLADFIDELSRYRTGTLRCDPQVANMLVSGAYPIHDIDAVLTSLTEHMPIRIETFTKYWITLKPTT